jgi:3-methyladenine DNA glycosylase/8-oxoguanine DNA glycosylase
MKITYDLKHSDIAILIEKDKKLKTLFETVGPLTIEIHQPFFPFLIFTILGQQLSTKVVDILYQRVRDLITDITPENVLSKGFDDYFKLGISRRKISTIFTLSEAALEGALDPVYFMNRSKADITKHLVSFKGIGPWTADMMMMFPLGDMDHFSLLDLGLVKAYQKLFNEASLDAIEKDAENWRPLRSIVAHYLWAYWDN